MKKRLIILIVVGFLFITSGIVGAVITRNNSEVGTQTEVNNSVNSNSSVVKGQNGRQYNNTSNGRVGMMRGYNNDRSSPCPFH